MSRERRGRFRAGEREELEEVLTLACADAFAAQAREERVRRRLLAAAAGDAEAGSAEIRRLLSALGDTHAELATLRERISRIRVELGDATDAAGEGRDGSGDGRSGAAAVATSRSPGGR